MGDRGNIKLIGGECFKTPVCLYTHWGGYDMKSTLAKALNKGRERWNDPSYLGRVIFQELIGGDDGVTGFGLSACLQDNEHPILVVDMGKQTVHEEPDSRNGFGGRLRSDSIVKPITFAAFVEKYAEPITP